MNLLLYTLMNLMAAIYNHIPSKNKYLRSDLGWINFSVGLRTELDTVNVALIFSDGRVSVAKSIPKDVNVTLILNSDNEVKMMLQGTTTDIIMMLLKSRARVEGNLAYLQLFNFYVSLLLGNKQIKQMKKEQREYRTELESGSNCSDRKLSSELSERRKHRMKADKIDPGVKYLHDPYLSEYTLEDFSRLMEFLDIHFETIPEICHELPKLVTDWYKKNGYESDMNGRPRVPEIRQARAYKYLMENRKPIIRKNDLVAGTTTTRDIGVVIYPDTHGSMIWGELITVPHRALNPYNVSEETINILHHDVFPYWTERNIREWVRKEYNNSLPQRLDERFAVYFLWKTVALSHTIADFSKLLKLGTRGIISEIRDELENVKSTDKKNTLQAMILCLEGLTAYSKNLSEQADREAAMEPDPARRKELKKLADICNRVPENPAQTLHEAVNAIWIGWVGLHMENTNAGLSIGRLD